MPILCGTDLSTASSGALDVALALAAQRGDRELVLLHVVDPETVSGGDAAIDAAVAKAAEAIAVVVTDRAGAVLVRPEVRVGPPDQTLVGTAETENADLIVIAASAKLGTTALAVISTASVPVIVVRDPAPWLAFARDGVPLKALIGVDDSAVTDLGIQWLHGLRQRGPVDVTLGAIYYPDDAQERYGVAGGSIVDRDPEVEQLLARDLVRRFGVAPAAAGGAVAARTKLGLGRIGDHVLELATDEGVHAIVIGTHQKTGLVGRLGSVSSVVVHDAKQSVVCVPPGAALGPARAPLLERALVATDFSPFANRAIPYAFAVVPPAGEVHVVHIVDGGEDDIDEADLGARLAALAPPGAPQRVVTHIVRGGDAATAIAQAAARLGVDVICIASHGRSGITRALMGSVADRLLRASRLPVLVLRPS